MTPELWTRCPNALGERYYYAGPDGEDSIEGIDWWCGCHGDGTDTLLPVALRDALPGGFDEAVERMMPVLIAAEADLVRPGRNPNTNDEAVLLKRLLFAALGEDTE